MPLTDKSNTYTGVGVGASGVGSLVSILGFALPYWIYYDEDLTLTDGSGSQQIQWTYYYGFWKYCNKVTSGISNSDRCGSVESQSDVEKTTATLLLLVILLFVSAIVNGCLYLTILKKEKLCLYITWISVVLAGILALASIVTFATTDHSIIVTSAVTLNFSVSKLHASFWLVVFGCLMVAIAVVFITLAIIHARRTEEKSDDRKSMVSYDSVNKSASKLIEDDNDIPEEPEYENANIPEAYPYRDSPYSTSSESLSDLCDSDDSEIEPEFAKLKTKITPKSSDLRGIESETQEVRRSGSGDPITMARSKDLPVPKTASPSLSRSRTASALTPIERPENDLLLTPKTASPSLNRSRSAAALTPVERSDDHTDFTAIDINPFYQDSIEPIEQGKAPVATNLIVAIPSPVDGSSNAPDLRRVKTDMPLTQKMMDIIEKRKQPLDSKGSSVRGDANIFQEQTSLSLPPKVQSFPKKPQTTKPKRKKLSEEDRKRMREMVDTYTVSPSVKTFFPGQHSQKPAPWSKARKKLSLQKKKQINWALKAYGVESLPKVPKSATKTPTVHRRTLTHKNVETRDFKYINNF